MTEQELKDLQERNKARVQATIAEMGDKWLLHPNNAVTKSKFKRLLKTSKKARLNK